MCFEDQKKVGKDEQYQGRKQLPIRQNVLRKTQRIPPEPRSRYNNRKDGTDVSTERTPKKLNEEKNMKRGSVGEIEET